MANQIRKFHPLVAPFATALNSLKAMLGTLTDPGHTHTATTAASTATNAAITDARHVHYEAPITADLVSIVNAVDITNVVLTIAAQPDFPRKLQVRIVDANSSVSAGVVTLVGIGARGQAVTQAIPLTGGTQTVVTTDAYATLTSATVTGAVGNVAGDTIGIGPGTALGLPGPSTPTAGTYAVHKSNVTNANETVGTVDATAGTIIPTSVPNGTRTYDFWFSCAYTPTQASHTHTLTTASGTTGITTAVGGTTKFHLDASEVTVTAADSSSEATALALVNEIAAVFYGSPTGTGNPYPGHALDTLAHVAADSTNGALTAARPATSLATAYTLANEIKADFNAHLTQSGVHVNNDGTNSIAAADATTQNSLNTLLNELKADLNLHMANAVPGSSLRAINA